MTKENGAIKRIVFHNALHLVCLIAGGVISAVIIYFVIPPTTIDTSTLDSFREPKQHASGCITLDENKKMLIVQHLNDRKYGPPAGFYNPKGLVKKKDIDITLADTAIRETLEETGYRVKVTRLLGSVENNNVLFTAFECSLEDPKPERKPDDEIIGIEWKDPNLIDEEDWKYQKQYDWILSLYTTARTGNKD